MEIRRKRHVATVVLLLIGLVASPNRSWGQAVDRIGTVLSVEGVAEVRAQDAMEWERLRFRDAIFLNDTVRTGAGSKMKILLRDDSIMTLGERSEVQFTEFLLTQDKRRTVVGLLFGQIRVLTARIFGAGSATEVHTPNAVAGIRGSEAHVQYDLASQRTTVFCASGGAAQVDHCYILDPEDPTKMLNVPEGHITILVEAQLLLPPRIATPDERQSIVQETAAAPPQDPFEVKTTEELAQEPQKTPRAPRGEVEPPTPPPPLPVVDVGEAPEEARVETGPEAIVEDLQTEVITPDTSPAAEEIIRRSQVNVRVNFPER